MYLWNSYTTKLLHPAILFLFVFMCGKHSYMRCSDCGIAEFHVFLRFLHNTVAISLYAVFSPHKIHYLHTLCSYIRYSERDITKFHLFSYISRSELSLLCQKIYWSVHTKSWFLTIYITFFTHILLNFSYKLFRTTINDRSHTTSIPKKISKEKWLGTDVPRLAFQD